MSSTEIKNSDELRRRSRVGCVVKGRGRKGYVPVPKRERKKGRLSACSISEHGTKGRVWISLTALGQFCHDRSAVLYVLPVHKDWQSRSRLSLRHVHFTLQVMWQACVSVQVVFITSNRHYE